MKVIGGDECLRMLDLKVLVLFLFSAEWCPACKSAEPIMDELEKLYSEKKEKIKMFKIELSDESNREFVEKCEVQSIPTFLFFKDRTIIDRVVGVNRDGVIKIINENIGGNIGENKESNINKEIFIKGKKQEVKKEIKQPVKQVVKEVKEEVKDFYPNSKFQGAYEGFTYKTGDKGLGYYKDKVSNGSKKIEIHMVYGDWCGHSKRAKPAFEELVEIKDTVTKKGTPVSFIMTDDKSPGMQQFKGKIQGFPTYMTVVKDGDKVESME